MQAAWTELWSAGHFDSLPRDRAAGVLASLDSTWKDFFSSFPDKAKLLDLATGGGDVIRAALALGRGFDIAGVDIADLSAVGVRFQIPAVSLVGNTDLSNLPFADATFDGVASQFGIEYADVAVATREAVRVLTPGGRGHFVSHHRESAITLGVFNSLAADRAVFADANIFALAKSVFELYRRSAPEASIAEAEAEFRNALRVLQSCVQNERGFRMARNAVGFLTRLADAPSLLPAAEALHRLDVVERDIRARMLRKQAQLNAALDRKGAARLSEWLAAAGAIVGSAQELRYPMGGLMAWSPSFRKRFSME